MLIVSSADKRFSNLASHLRSQCKRVGYSLAMYDLGDLGFGTPMTITNETFVELGYYKVMNPDSGWCSRALHKPEVIRRTEFEGTLAYMDADAFPVARFDEIEEHDFDIGVTVRDKSEEYGKMGRINAGVMFLKNTTGMKEFVREWGLLTAELGNDQVALNKTIDTGKYNVKEFPTKIYNYYYFPEKPGPEVKIYHFKSKPEVRSEFPNYATLL